MTAVSEKERTAIDGSALPSTSSSEEIVRDASYFTACTYIYQLTAFVVGMATKRFLGPEGAGTWSFFMMVLSYLALQHVGIIDGSERQIAYYRGKGQGEYAHRIKNNMFGLVGLISLLSAILITAFAITTKGMFSEHMTWALLHVGMIIPVFMAVNYVTVSLRATKRFKLLGRTLVAVAALNGTAGILLVWKWQLNGMFIAFLLINSTNLVVWYLVTRKDKFLSFKFSLCKSVSAEALKVGFPIALLGLVWTLLRTVDSLVVVSVFGTQALGFYALGVSVNAFIFHTPNALSIVMFPRFQEKFGQSSDISHLEDYVIKPITAMAFLALPLLIGSAFFFVPVLVRVVLPKFTPGIIPLKILLAGTYWISLVLMPINLLITVNRQMQAVYFGLLGAVMSLVGASLAVKLGWGLPGTASLVALSYMVFFSALITYVISYSKWEIRPIKYMTGIAAAFAWMCITILACDYWLGEGISVLSQTAWAVGKFAVFTVAVSPLFVVAERSTGVISKCRQHIADMIGGSDSEANRMGRKK